MRVLDTLIESADRRLENIVGTAGRYKGNHKSFRHGKGALVAADALLPVLRRLVLMELRVSECRAALAVPYFLVVLVRHLHIVVRGVRTVVETDDIDRVIQLFVISHTRNDIQSLILIGCDNADIMIRIDRVLVKVVREIRLILKLCCDPFDKCFVRISCLIFIRIYKINDISVFLICVKNCFPVPLINRLISLA